MKNKQKTLVLKLGVTAALREKGKNVTRKKWRVKKKIPLYMSKRLMKRLKRFMKGFGMLSVMLVPLLFSGCARLGGYTEPEEVVTVAALGFDVAEGGVKVSMQTVDHSGEQVKVSEGESVSHALSSIISGGTVRPELSHCALIAVGDGIGQGVLSEIFELCENERELSDAVLFVSCHSAEGLLSLDGAAGYDTVSAMRSFPGGAGLFSENRFYEIRNREKAGGEGAMALPYFHVSEGEYSISGLKLYTDRSERVILDRRESVLYLMMEGIYTSGSVDYLYGGKMRSAEVRSTRTEHRRGDKNLVICRLTLGDMLTVSEKKALEDSLSRGAEELYEGLFERYGDLFGFSDAGEPWEFEFIAEGV